MISALTLICQTDKYYNRVSRACYYDDILFLNHTAPISGEIPILANYTGDLNIENSYSTNVHYLSISLNNIDYACTLYKFSYYITMLESNILTHRPIGYNYYFKLLIDTIFRTYKMEIDYVMSNFEILGNLRPLSIVDM